MVNEVPQWPSSPLLLSTKGSVRPGRRDGVCKAVAGETGCRAGDVEGWMGGGV